MARYDLTREPWIPVLDQGGGLRHVGLRDALADAHHLREIYTDSPIEVAALNRLLLALAIRIFPETAEEDDWLDRWRVGAFDTAPIDAYFDRWRHRFDLLDPERPFYQHPAPMVSKASAISRLFNEEASGNNATLFSHAFDEQPRRLDLARAARGVVATQAAAIGGGVAKPFNLSHAPLIAGALFWMRGHSLFEALMLNASPSEKCRMGDPKDGDRPAWERDLKTPARRVPDGYLDYLTWQSRLLLLECEASDDGEAVATALRISQGDKEISGNEDAPGTVDDPLMAYRKSKDKGIFAYRVNAERALWRDTALFFSLFSDEGGGGPRVFQWAADEEDRLKERCWMVDVFGMATDQARIELWRRERLPLYTPYLRDINRWKRLEGALDMAGEHARTLHRACETLGSYLLFPTKDNLLSQIERAEASTFARALDAVDRFWVALEVPFWGLVAELAETDDLDGTVEGWRGTLGRLALGAFHNATRSLDTTARHLRALAHAEHYIRRNTRINTTHNSTIWENHHMADQPQRKLALSRFWSHLFRLYNEDDRASLAKLRRAVAEPVNGDVFAVIGNAMPSKISGHDISDRQIDAHLLAACLFAVHPTTVSAESARYSLGASMRRLRAKLSVGAESLDARFASILNSEREDLPSRLRHAIRLLASHDVPVDYPQLLRDLLGWGNEDRYVQRRWAIDYWTGRDGGSDDGENAPEPAESDAADA